MNIKTIPNPVAWLKAKKAEGWTYEVQYDVVPEFCPVSGETISMVTVYDYHFTNEVGQYEGVLTLRYEEGNESGVPDQCDWTEFTLD